LHLGADLVVHDSVHAMMTAGADGAIERATVDFVAQVTPQLAAETRRWNRVIATKSLVWTALIAVALAATSSAVAYGTGWKAGAAQGFTDRSALAGAISGQGRRAEAALVRFVLDNDLPSVLTLCEASRYSQNGREACMAPLWLEPAPPPGPPSS
jgi:hypothetical protein